MTSYARAPETVTFQPQEGGMVRSGSDEVLAPEQLSITPSGTAFGPLEAGVAEGGMLTLDRVRFGPGESDDGGLLFGAGALAIGSTKASDTSTTRRGVLALVAATVLAGAATQRGAAQSDDEEVTLRVGELEVAKTTAPIRIRVIDIVDDVLPSTTELLVDAAGTRVGTISEPSEGVSLPADTTGTVRVYLRDSRGQFAQLLAWANSFLSFDEPITFRREFPDGKQASDYSEGEFVRLTRHPSIIGPVEDQGPEATVLTIGNTDIPHEEEGGDEAGAWALFDGSMVYEPGPNPPAASEYEVRVGVGALSRWLD
jgi:hypothetical protein